jgi:hypothetical protein
MVYDCLYCQPLAAGTHATEVSINVSGSPEQNKTQNDVSSLRYVLGPWESLISMATVCNSVLHPTWYATWDCTICPMYSMGQDPPCGKPMQKCGGDMGLAQALTQGPHGIPMSQHGAACPTQDT